MHGSLQSTFEEGVRYHRSGDLEGAITRYSHVVSSEPQNAQACLNLGVALRAKGFREEGLKCLERAAQHAPDNVDAQFNLGNALRDAGRHEEARDRYRRALDLWPSHLRAARNLALTDVQIGRVDDAVAVYGEVIRVHPDSADLLNELGVLLWRQRHRDGAIALYERSLAIDGKHLPTLINLGIALNSTGDHDRALDLYRQAMRLKSDLPAAYSGAGQVLVSLGHCEEALEAFDAALTLDPKSLDARMGRARALFLMGRLVEAWNAYECRWHSNELSHPNLPGRPWQGETLTGQTLLLYAEQGLGDALQFARYAALAAAQGATVIVLCPEPILSVMRSVPSVAAVASTTRSLPRFDLHCSFLDLPRIFRTRLETIPSDITYMTPPDRAADTRLSADISKLKVGLVWSGNPKHENDHNRSCGLKVLISLLSVPGIACYSLQVGPGVDEIAKLGLGPMVTDLGTGLKDFGDTAAVLSHIDLLVSVDTAIVHLAGALGRPVWTLLPFAPDWRWLLNRDTSPWYPTMRLFRQTRPGDWDGVVAELRESLHQIATESRGSRLSKTAVQ